MIKYWDYCQSFEHYLLNPGHSWSPVYLVCHGVKIDDGHDQLENTLPVILTSPAAAVINNQAVTAAASLIKLLTQAVILNDGGMTLQHFFISL